MSTTRHLPVGFSHWQSLSAASNSSAQSMVQWHDKGHLGTESRLLRLPPLVPLKCTCFLRCFQDMHRLLWPVFNHNLWVSMRSEDQRDKLQRCYYWSQRNSWTPLSLSLHPLYQFSLSDVFSWFACCETQPSSLVLPWFPDLCQDPVFTISNTTRCDSINRGFSGWCVSDDHSFLLLLILFPLDNLFFLL